MNYRSEDERAQLVGVEGWLSFLVAVLLFLGPVTTVVLTMVELNQTEELYPEVVGSALWDDAQLITWISVAAFCVVSVFAGWRLLKHHTPSSVFIAIVSLWVAGPIVSLISLAALDDAGGRVTAADVGATIGRPLVWATIWTLYLVFSRRVKNTYLAGQTLGTAAIAPWRSVSKRSRQLVFFSLCWLVLSFLYFQLFEPMGRYPNDEEVETMWMIVLLPPFLLIIGSWAYRRIVGVED
jgi:hypothetical protein